MNSTFLFGPFRAEGITLSASDFVDGIPSPQAALGLIGSIARDLGCSGWSHRALLIIHDLQEFESRTRGEMTISKKTKKLSSLDIPEVRRGHGTFSIIGEFPGVHDVSSVIDRFAHKRFSGGPIFEFRNTTLEQAVQPIDETNFEKLIRGLPRGYVLSPASGLEGAELVSFGEVTSLEQIARRAYDLSERKTGEWVVPVPAGFAILEPTFDEKPPKGSRDPDIPFAFVDSAVGLGQFVSIRREEVFSDLQAALSNFGWAWATDDSKGLAMLSDFHLKSVRQH